jgi:hypothetical protein
MALTAIASLMLAHGPVLAATLTPTLTAFHAVDRQWAPLHQGDLLNSGDKVVFKINYLNGDWSSAPAGDVFFSVPPDVLLTGIDDEHTASFSVDGGKTFDALGRLRVYKAGRWTPARITDVTHVRWRVAHPIDAGGADTFIARGVRD